LVLARTEADVYRYKSRSEALGEVLDIVSFRNDWAMRILLSRLVSVCPLSKQSVLLQFYKVKRSAFLDFFPSLAERVEFDLWKLELINFRMSWASNGFVRVAESGEKGKRVTGPLGRGGWWLGEASLLLFHEAVGCPAERSLRPLELLACLRFRALHSPLDYKL